MSESGIQHPNDTLATSSVSGENSHNTAKQTAVYCWHLDDGKTESAIPNYVDSLVRVHKADKIGGESVINSVDGRTLVNLDDYQKPDGQYRAIVKLFLLYETQLSMGQNESDASWAMATGWLVSKDLVVTAGHCAFDHSHGYGRLVKVKAYVGYTGKESIVSKYVEFRLGRAVATCPGWVDTDGGDERFDVSYIKLASPFKDVEHCFVPTPTPISKTAANLGVVGYPGDIANATGERGAMMYKMFAKTDYNLQVSDMHMLQYKIDTYGGNSGSPVLNDEVPRKAIGVHVLGGYKFNSASVIDGPYGNRFEALQKAASSFDGATTDGAEQPDKEKKPWLWMMHPAVGPESITSAIPVRDPLDEIVEEAERLVIKTPSTILRHNEPVSFGPVLGPQISVLAAGAIAAAGRLAADSKSAAHAESLANTRPYDGSLERAILAEAALQSYLQLRKTSGTEKVEEFLGPVVTRLTPFVVRAAPKILKGILEPSLRLLLAHTLGDDVDKKAVRKRPEAALAAEMATGFGRALTDNESKFVEGLMNEVDDDTVTEFFSTFSTIGQVIGSAFKRAVPVLVDVAKITLPALLGTESSVPSSETSLVPLAHRAMLAEACLQAYVALPDVAEHQKVYKKMLKVVQKIGPRLMKFAPTLVKHVGPVVADLLREYDVKEEQERKKQEFLDFNWGSMSK